MMPGINLEEAKDKIPISLFMPGSLNSGFFPTFGDQLFYILAIVTNFGFPALVGQMAITLTRKSLNLLMSLFFSYPLEDLEFSSTACDIICSFSGMSSMRFVCIGSRCGLQQASLKKLKFLTKFIKRKYPCFVVSFNFLISGRKSTGPHIQLRVVTRKPNKGIIYRFINRCPYLAASHSRFSLLASVFLMVYNGSWMQK